MPRCRKGKTQVAPVRGPEVVVQLGRVIDSFWQLEVEDTSQSPQELVTTVPVESTPVAHHGVGESAYVHW